MKTILIFILLLTTLFITSCSSSEINEDRSIDLSYFKDNKTDLCFVSGLNNKYPYHQFVTCVPCDSLSKVTVTKYN